ncbi:MAG: energy transducer TonB [Gammaproteobacteria bacterium]|nr:energy transducer TonB [Gammaproteobacteria bacterium]
MLSQYTRFATAIGIGAAVTFGLLFIMQYMIASGNNALGDENQFRIVDFVRVERNETVERKKEKPEKPPEPEMQPEMPEPQVSNFQSSLAVSMVAPPVTMNSEIGSLGFGVSDGEYLPIVKVAPIYPPRAAARGLEGHVVVEYTVTRTGETKDIVVIESTSSLFDRAAVESASKYKYKPRVIDGIAVEVPGVTTKIIFELED